MPPPDQDATRSRLLEAAGPVFAEKGFPSATVREICLAAGANIAAVNYHFRDKMGLYVEVLKRSVTMAHNSEGDLSELPPGQALTAVIAGMIRRMLQAGDPGSTSGAAWHVRIMAHELAHPTAALDRVVDEVIRPRSEMLRALVSRIIGLPAEHETTLLCVLSLIGQTVHYAHARPVIERIAPEMNFDPDRIAAHIATFSLAGLHAVAATVKKQEAA